ncbi:MAG: hypothetical protein H5T24_04900, partial [Bacteroidales bacterium]|nr:hypothetical protein [Bacteroidales bacterium]
AAIDYEMAKMWELSRETNDDWVRTALVSFKKREFKPGLQYPYQSHYSQH